MLPSMPKGEIVENIVFIDVKGITSRYGSEMSSTKTKEKVK